MKSMLHLFFAVTMLVGCGSSATTPYVPHEEPPAPVPLPQPTPTPVPEPVPSPQPDPFVHDVSFRVFLHNEDGPRFDALTIALFRAGVEVQRAQVSNGLAVIPQMLPGEVEVRLFGLSLLHTFTPFIVGVTNESKDFLVLVSLRDHGSSVLFGDSNTSEGGSIPTTYRTHLERSPVYQAALGGIRTEVENLAVPASGLTDVWGDTKTYGAHQVTEFFQKNRRTGGDTPLFINLRYGLIDIRNKWKPDEFEKELREIVELALGHGVVPILSFVSYQENGRDERAINECNQIFSRVAQDYGLPLVDLALEWNEQDFVDDRHQSDQGNLKVAERAAEVISVWLTSAH